MYAPFGSIQRADGDPASLATETDYVRGRLAEYGNDLLSLGADGFRLDAAKSRLSMDLVVRRLTYAVLDINYSDISNILSRLTSTPYITQEVIWGSGQPVTPNQYTGNGTLRASAYSIGCILIKL